MRRLIASVLLVATACSSGAAAQSDPVAEPRISLPVSLYIVRSATSEGLSSGRTVDELEVVAEKMAAIWEVAGITLDIDVVGAIEVPDDVIRSVATRDGRAFLSAAAEGRFEVPDLGAIAGFYVPSAGGANGFAPLLSRAFFVTDHPTVHDERVSSHEIGHLLGLHHATSDESRLMFSGTNGMSLTSEEIAAARYVAQGMVDGVR